MVRNNIRIIYACAGVAVLYASLLYYQTSIARPDAFGLLLFMLSIYLPYFMRYTNMSLALSIVIGVLAFYTKQYYILSCIYVGTYLFLFVSKRMGILFTLTFTLVTVTSVVIMNHMYNVYFLNTIFAFKCTSLSYRYLFAQLRRYCFVNVGFLFIVVIYMYGSLRSVKWSRISPLIFNVSNLSEPFINYDCSLSLHCTILSFVVIFFLLGRNYGAWMTYLYQLITPFFLVVTFGLIDSIRNMDGPLQKIRAKYGYLFVISFILLSVYRSCYALTFPSPEAIHTWRALEGRIVSHKNILNSPAIVPLLVEQNKPVYDSGLSGGWRYIDCANTIFSRFLPSDEEVKYRWTKYVESIDSMASRQEFDMIILTDDLEDYYISKDTLNKFYQKTESKLVYLYHTDQRWRLSIWEPKKP